MTKKKILVVDDELIGRQLLEAVLLPHGYEIFLAEDGFEAIDKAKNHIPDIILMDVMMPGMDGYATVNKIKAIPETENIPVIMVTALDDRDSRIRGLEQGAIDYISKPFDRIEILNKIKNSLQQSVNLSASNTDSSISSADNINTSVLIDEICPPSKYIQHFKGSVDVLKCGIPMGYNIEGWAHSTLGTNALCLFGPTTPEKDTFLQNCLVNIWLGDITRNTTFEAEEICDIVYTKMKSSKHFDFAKSPWWLHVYVQTSKNQLACAGVNMPLFVHNSDKTKKRELERDEALLLDKASTLILLSNQIANNIDKELLLEHINAHMADKENSTFETSFNELVSKTGAQSAFGIKITF